MSETAGKTLVWLQRCYEKGWLSPIEVVDAAGVVLYGKDELVTLLDRTF